MVIKSASGCGYFSALAVAFISAACGHALASSPDTLSISVDPTPAWGPDVAITAESRTTLVSSPTDDLFSGAIACDRHGLVYVCIPTENQIHVFNPSLDETARLTIADDPSDGFQILSMQCTPSGGLAAWDPRAQMIRLFDPEKGSVRQLRVASGYYGTDVFHVDRFGNFYVRTGGQTFTSIDSYGAKRSEVHLPDERTSGPLLTLTGHCGRRRCFDSRQISTLDNSGRLVTAWNRSYEINIVGSAVVRIVKELPEPSSIHPAEKEQWEAFLKWRGKNVADMPETKPVLRDLRVDQDGRIWVDRYVAAEKIATDPPIASGRPVLEWRERPTFDIITLDGTFLGTIQLPHDTYLIDSFDDWMLALIKRRTLVRFRIST